MNDPGMMAFTATLVTDQANVPTWRWSGRKAASRAWSTNLDAPPGLPDAKFEEFSAPLVTSDGNLISERAGQAKGAGSGLFQWSARGLQALPLPAGFAAWPQGVAGALLFGHDEAAFLRRGASAEAATEQFFRAIAIQTFQQMQPQPDSAHLRELLAARPGSAARPNAAGLP